MAVLGLVTGLAPSPDAAAAAAGPPEEVPNGDFEKVDADGQPASWAPHVRREAGGTARLALDPAVRRRGRRALRLDVQGPGSIEIDSAPVAVRGGADYLLSLWYRADGMSRSGRFEGVNAFVRITWRDASGAALGGIDVGAPYRARDWGPMLRIATAPPAAARAELRAVLAGRRGGPASSVWLDDIRLRAWRTKAEPGGEARSWSVAQHDGFGAPLRKVADDDTASGHSVVADPRFHSAPANLASRLATAELEPGAWRAVFRLRVAAAAGPEPVVSLDVSSDGTVVNNVLALLEPSAAAIGEPGRYREVELPFIRPHAGKVHFRARWLGGPATWLDLVSVRRERLLDRGSFDDVLSP